MKLLLTSLLVVAVAALASAKPASEIDNTGGEYLPDYNCASEGVFSDPAECDCYIVCSSELKAYRHVCAKRNGVQLFFKQSYTLSTGGDICDLPSVAACPNDPTTTPKPVRPLPCVNETEGDSCNPMVDCRQCGYCDEYLYCKSITETTGIWTRERCVIRGSADLVHIQDKLFWNQGSTVHGGTCAPWTEIPRTVQDDYLADPECKQPCEFKEDGVCAQVYHYREPDIKKDIWMTNNFERLTCEAGTQWNQETKTCKFCEDPSDPGCNCA